MQEHTTPEIDQKRQNRFTPLLTYGIPPWGDQLTRDEVEWLVKEHEQRRQNTTEKNDGPKSLNLSGVILQGINLNRLPLAGVILSHANLKRASCTDTDFTGAQLTYAQLQGAVLKRANLRNAHLEEASMQDADLQAAHLEGANLKQVKLAGARLQGAYFDHASTLTAVSLGGVGDEPKVVSVADVRWGGANLAVVNWPPQRMILGDEREVRLPKKISRPRSGLVRMGWWPSRKRGDKNHSPQHSEQTLITQAMDTRQAIARHKAWSKALKEGRRRGELPTLPADLQEPLLPGKVSQRRLQTDLLTTAARAYRQLAKELREQGVTEQADYCALHVQQLQREIYGLQRRPLKYLFSWVLAVLTGYGYRMWGLVLAYVSLLASFALLYYFSGLPNPQPLTPWEALLVSLMAFHGRVFSNPFPLSTVQAYFTAAEAISGVLLEGLFIGMLAQRFLGR